VLIGQVDYAYCDFDPQAVRGALSSMLLEYGLNTIATRHFDETAHLLAILARQEQVGIPRSR
jgi:ERCC4-type nuclease